MKTIFIPIFMLMMAFCAAQKYSQQKKEIESIITAVKESIIKKDTTTFKSLFTKDSFNWTAVITDKTQQKRIEKDHKAVNTFTKNFNNFYSFLLDKGEQEEIFRNVSIENNDVIASVIFDYSFLSNRKASNWGKEFWHLAKINGQWKITSVIYSLEFNN